MGVGSIVYVTPNKVQVSGSGFAWTLTESCCVLRLKMLLKFKVIVENDSILPLAAFCSFRERLLWDEGSALELPMEEREWHLLEGLSA